MKKLLTTTTFLSLSLFNIHAASIEDLTKDVLINSSSHTLSGTFAKYNFSDTDDAFNWAFTATNGISYQLRGKEPSPDDVFGWKSAGNIDVPTPQWYMFSVDIDGNGKKDKFEWILLSADINKKAAYKLVGSNENGTFAYSKSLDIDYEINGDTISTGIEGAFSHPTNEPCSSHCEEAIYVPSNNKILQNINYSVGYEGGTQLIHYTVDSSSSQSCKLHVLPTTSTYNSYSDYSYTINGKDGTSQNYLFTDNGFKEITFSIGWMYYTTTESHLDFYVECEDVEIEVPIVEIDPSQDPMPEYSKEKSRNNSLLVHEGNKEYVSGVATFHITSNISLAQWYSYKLVTINFIDGIGNPKNNVTLLEGAKLTDKSNSVPGKITCTHTKTDTQPIEYNFNCKLLDTENNILAQQVTTVPLNEGSLNISSSVNYIYSNYYYLITDYGSFSGSLE